MYATSRRESAKTICVNIDVQKGSEYDRRRNVSDVVSSRWLYDLRCTDLVRDSVRVLLYVEKVRRVTMDERTEQAIILARQVRVRLLDSRQMTTAGKMTEVVTDLDRLSALVASAPQWMERPNAPGLYVVEFRDSPTTLWRISEHNVAHVDTFVNSYHITRVYGPIPKGAANAT